MIRLVSIAVLCTVLVSAGAFAQDRAPWMHVLEAQLQKEKKCKLLRVENITRLKVLGVETLRADAYCTDGRVYTVTQGRPPQAV